MISLSASLSLPFVNESHKECYNEERIIELDGIIQAYLSNHVANRASIRQVIIILSCIISLFCFGMQSQFSMISRNFCGLNQDTGLNKYFILFPSFEMLELLPLDKNC